jgi:hypothetical protein
MGSSKACEYHFNVELSYVFLNIEAVSKTSCKTVKIKKLFVYLFCFIHIRKPLTQEVVKV